MIKWFCDVCKKEIEKPNHPDFVNAHFEGKNRGNAEIGWGDSREIVKLCCHKECAMKIGDAIKKAVAEIVEP